MTAPPSAPLSGPPSASPAGRPTGLPALLRRVAALSLPFAVVGALYLFAVAPLLQSYERGQEELAHARDMLARTTAIAAQRDAVEAEVAALRRRQSESGLFVRGDSEALATAALQDHVSAAVAESGGSLRSLEGLSSESAQGMTRLSMQARLIGDIREVANLLHLLESRQPLLFVEELSLRGRLTRDRGESVTVTPELLVDILVTGYRLDQPS